MTALCHSPPVSSHFYVQESWEGFPEREHMARCTCIAAGFVWVLPEVEPETRIQEQVVYLKGEESPSSRMGK